MSKKCSKQAMENFLLVTLFMLVYYSKCDDAIVFISEQLGHDSENCSSRAFPCKTLNYGYEKAVKDGHLKILDIIITGKYTMNKSFTVNTSHANLTAVNIYGSDNAEVFGSEYGYFTLGCEDKTQCVKHNIRFENLTFRNFHQQVTVSAFQITKLEIVGCRFIDSNNSALRWVDTEGGIDNCFFGGGQYNGALKGLRQEGGAVGLTFNQAYNKSVFVKNSTFLNNKGNVNLTAFRNHSIESLLYFSYFGGGLAVLFLNESTSNRIVVDSCRFDGNNALFGGGLAYCANIEAKRNSLKVVNSYFSRNFAYLSGGGFSLKVMAKASANSLTFENVTFQNNSARECGGAGRLILESIDSEPVSPIFINTKFLSNRAQTAAAIGIGKTSRDLHFNWQKSVVFINTVFQWNSNYPNTLNTSFIHTGTLASYKVNVLFHGRNNFMNNTINSPLFVCGAIVNVSGIMLFKENYAYSSGGGMSLLDGSTLLLMPGTNLTFERNYALTVGGALLYKTSAVVNEIYEFNPFCFMQYGKIHVPASQWNVHINFIENGAGLKGAAIYATTLGQCKWTEDYPNSDISRTLRWSNRFVYRGNYIGTFWHGKEGNDIATDTYKYIYKPERQAYSYPGQDIILGISAVDELDNSVISVPTIFSTDWINNRTSPNSSLVLDRHLLYLDSNTTTFRYSMQSPSDYEAVRNGKDKDAHYVQIIDYLSIYGSRFVAKINPAPCSPGYKFDSSKLQCSCDLSINGLTRCNGTMVRLRSGIWGNVSQSNPHKLVTFQCPRHYCQCNTGDAFQSDCELDPNQPDHQCTGNRNGMLCGKCRKGTSITLPSYSCIECEDPAQSMAVFIIVIIATVCICLAIFYFNPKMSEYMKGIFFYTQILPYVFTANGKSALVATTFSTVVNSVAVGSMPKEMCLFDNIDLIDAIGISYVIPSLCALILFIVFILSKLRLLTFHRDSPFNSFWVLTIMVFKLLVETTMKSMACFKVDGKVLFFYDGSEQCFSKGHLALFIPSVLILAIFLIPAPVFIVLISFGYIRVSPHVSDIISQGYRKSCRWWCAVDLGRRIAFSAVFTFVSNWYFKQTLFIFLSATVCLIHVIAQPYKKSLANHGESFLLVSLCLIAALQGISGDEELRETGSIIPLSLTIIYTAAVVCYLVSVLVFKCFKKWGNFGADRLQRSPRDIDGAPYNIPKRVHLKSPNFWENRRGSSDSKVLCNPAQAL